jgi:hypothetical protein
MSGWWKLPSVREDKALKVWCLCAQPASTLQMEISSNRFFFRVTNFQLQKGKLKLALVEACKRIGEKTRLKCKLPDDTIIEVETVQHSVSPGQIISAALDKAITNGVFQCDLLSIREELSWRDVKRRVTPYYVATAKRNAPFSKCRGCQQIIKKEDLRMAVEARFTPPGSGPYPG